MSFDILRTLDNDELRFGVFDYHIDGYLTIQVTSSLPFDKIDSKIRSVLEEEWDLSLVEKKEDFEHKLFFERGSLDCSRGWESTGGTLKYKVEAKPQYLSDHQIITKRLMKSWGTKLLVNTIETEVDRFYVTFTTNLSLKQVDSLFRETLNEFNLMEEYSDMSLSDIIGYHDGVLQYQFNKTLEAKVIFDEEASNVPVEFVTSENPILKENTVLDYPHGVPNKFGLRNDSCPDCKDGFYYPLVGPPEPCRTCK